MNRILSALRHGSTLKERALAARELRLWLQLETTDEANNHAPAALVHCERAVAREVYVSTIALSADRTT